MSHKTTIFIIVTKKLKKNILDLYQIPFSEFVESTHGCPLLEYGATVNYAAFPNDTDNTNKWNDKNQNTGFLV